MKMDQKTRYGVDMLLIALAVVTLALAFWGWVDVLTQQPCSTPNPTPVCSDAPFEDAAFHSIRIFAFNDVYDDPNEWRNDWRLRIARFLGTLVAFGALFRAVVALGGSYVARVQAITRTQHAVVLGDAELATQFTRYCSKIDKKATHHHGGAINKENCILNMPRPARVSAPFTKQSLNGADRVIVAEGDDAATIKNAVELSRILPRIPIFAVIENDWLLRRSPVDFAANNRERNDLLITVSLSSAAARALMAKFPPFWLANKFGQGQIHVLIIGFDRLGEALLVDLLNSSAVSSEHRPMVTIVDRVAAVREREFRTKFPGLVETDEQGRNCNLDIKFVEADVSSAEEIDIELIRRRASELPITAAYVAVGRASSPLACALALEALASKHDLFSTPIFVRNEEGPSIRNFDYSVLENQRPVISFGNWEDTIIGAGMVDPHPDQTAIEVHREYESFGTEKPADTSWFSLSEEFRRSNRASVAHIPAKLFVLGHDLTPFLEGKTGSNAPLSPNALPHLPADAAFSSGEEDLMKLAELEHERWMIDRWLGGWRFGEKRDDARRIHDDLRPFDQLDELTRSYDIQYARWLAEKYATDLRDPS